MNGSTYSKEKMATNLKFIKEDNSDEISKLHMANLNFALAINNLQEKYKELYQQHSEQTEELEDVYEEKSILKKKLKRASAIFYELEPEIVNLKSLLLTAHHKNKELEKKNKDLEEKLASSLTPAQSEDQLRKNLERKRTELEETRQNFESQLKNEWEKLSAQKTELTQMRADLIERSRQLDSANRKISGNENEIRELRSIISGQRRQEKRFEERIQSLETELKNVRGDLLVHTVLVGHQKQQIEQLKGQEQLLINSQRENKTLRKNCLDMKESKTQVKNQMNVKLASLQKEIARLKQVISDMEIAHEYETLKSDSKCDKFMKFVEKLEKISEFQVGGEGEAQSIENQLDQLEAHICEKWGNSNARKTIKTVPPPPLLSQEPEISLPSNSPPPSSPPQSTNSIHKKVTGDRFFKEVTNNRSLQNKRPRLSTTGNVQSDKSRDDESTKIGSDEMRQSKEWSSRELKLVLADTDEEVDVEGL